MKRSHRHVAVILNEDVEGTGFAGQLVNARAGYARNFLLMDGRADVATPDRVKQRESEIAKAEGRRQAEISRLQEVAQAIESESLKMTLKTGPNNRVFGSVTANDVVKTLKERKVELATAQLHGLPIKRLGDSPVSVKLGLGVSAILNVNVSGQRQSSDESDEE